MLDLDSSFPEPVPPTEYLDTALGLGVEVFRVRLHVWKARFDDYHVYLRVHN